MANAYVDTRLEADPAYIGRIRRAERCAKVDIRPQWARSGNSCWYLREYPDDRSEFILVDAVKRTREPAFDHEVLARKLSQQTGTDINPRKLPFQWIELDSDGSSVRFRFEDKTWRFSSDNSLSTIDGDIDEPKVEILPTEEASSAGGVSTSITFVNKLAGEISTLWIDTRRQRQFYGKLGPGQSRKQHTYEGHVWRVDDADGNALVICRAVKDHAILEITDQFTERESFAQEHDQVGANPEAASAKEPSDAPTSTPKARDRVFVKGFNVHYKGDDGTETQMSWNGAEGQPYCEDLSISPDGLFAVVWQYTPAEEHTVYLVESSPKDQLQPKLHSVQYPKPGDRVRIDRPRLFSLTEKREITTNEELFANPYMITKVGWSTDSKEYRIIYNQRGHQCVRLLGISREGTTRTIVEEVSQTFIDYSNKMYRKILEESSELIWASERDGRNHLYLYDLATGEVKSQITHGEYVVREVERVDEKLRRIWFKVLAIHQGEDPYYQHLARINFDGTGLTVLTHGDGSHSWDWSPNHRWFIDRWSRMDQATKIVLRDAESGRPLVGLEQGSLKQLSDVGWSPPELFAAPGRDGKTLVYGLIIKPADCSPDKHYPVLEEIYAGPHDFYTPKEFSSQVHLHSTSDQGFVVVQLDGMGTNWRTKQFHDVCYKNLKDAGFPDRILWITAAAKSRPWMDLSRVGIYGVSAGGQNAMGALLFHGEFYKAAVADSGCHDNRMDKLWWPELFMGWPVDASYHESSNVVHASQLTGSLMLMVGELDKNVDPSSTFQVVNALHQANKYYELVVFPGAGHAPGIGKPYGNFRMREFFKRALKASEKGV